MTQCLLSNFRTLSFVQYMWT